MEFRIADCAITSVFRTARDSLGNRRPTRSLYHGLRELRLCLVAGLRRVAGLRGVAG
jgi:hypothetical protein